MGTIYRNGVPFIGTGGGGGTSTDVELTQAEYDALPDTKLTDNINYFITDGNPVTTGVISAEGVQYNNNLNVKQALDGQSSKIVKNTSDIASLNDSLTSVTILDGTKFTSSVGTFSTTFTSLVYNNYFATLQVRFTPTQNIEGWSLIFTLPDDVKPKSNLTVLMGNGTSFFGIVRIENDGKVRPEISLSANQAYEFSVSFLR